MGRERFELSTFRLSAERSNQAEPPALSAVLEINVCLLKDFLRNLLVFRGNPLVFYLRFAK